MFAEDIISVQLCILHWSYYLVFGLNRLLGPHSQNFLGKSYEDFSPRENLWW